MNSPRSTSRSSASGSDQPRSSIQRRGGSARGPRTGGPTVVYSAGPDTARSSSAFGVGAFIDGGLAPAAPPRGPVINPDRAARGPRTSGAPEFRGRNRSAAPATGSGQRDPRRRGADSAQARRDPMDAAPGRRERSNDRPAAGTGIRSAAARDSAATVSTSALFAGATTITAAAAPLSDITFAELGVPARLIDPLAELGAVSPFPIQAATLPNSLAGRDVLGRGRTGSGKTIAFAIPLVARLSGGRRTPHRPRGLVLLPTRELALQVQRTIEPLATAAGLKTVTIFGGVGFGAQISALRSGVDIVIACPGRLEDLISQRACNLADVEVTVLDEADHMADLGFLPGVRRLLRATRPDGQRLLFSATLDNGISVLVNDFLTNPAVHAVDDETSPVEAMTHHVFAVSKDDRTQVIRELASGDGRRLLFTRTKHGAKKWAAALSKSGIAAVDLHGNLAQNARERNLAAFSSGSAKVLVATDIAARGIHVDDIELVVHLDPPAEHKAYLHRSGRTARAGAGGAVVTVMLPEQADDVRKLMKQAGISASTTSVAPGHPAIRRIAG